MTCRPLAMMLSAARYTTLVVYACPPTSKNPTEGHKNLAIAFL